MIKVENIEVFNFKGAIRGMRNALLSHDKSDSYDNYEVDYEEQLDEDGRPYDVIEIRYPYYRVGAGDINLMRKLYKAGGSHRKYARQIMVSMDITAPDYWFKQLSTYKVGTVENSTSTMHRIHSKEFTLDDFSTDHLEDFSWNRLDDLIEHLNICRKKYIETKDKKYWWQMIQLLPMSYNYTRTVTMNYENVFNIIHQRSGHKLDEWKDFCEVLKGLPYVKAIME